MTRSACSWCVAFGVSVMLPSIASAQKLVTATGTGTSPSVRVIDAGGTDTTFQPYDPAFLGGVRVALGDVTGDGVLDIITAAGPGGGPHVRVWNGTDLTEVGGFFAYSPAFSGGVYVAAGDVTGDGKADIITGAGPGGGPHVRVWDGATFAEVGGFFAYDPAFPGGVRVTAGDVTGDGVADIITAAGPGGGPHVRVWNGATFAEVGGFFAYDPAFAGGVFVAAGDITGDGKAEIVTGAGPGGGPHVRVWNGATFAEVGGFFAYDPSFGGGVVVGLSDLDRDGLNEIITAPGPGAPAQVRIWSGTGFGLWGAYLAVPSAFLGGVFIGSVAENPSLDRPGINDAPSFTRGPDPSSLEDAGPQTIANWATNISPGPPDETGQSVAFVVINNTNPLLFSVAPAVSPSGTLTYRSAPNAFGSADITLVLQDNGGTANGGDNTSTARTFTITVTPVNDPLTLTTPVIAYGTVGNTQLHVAGATVPGLASIADAASILSKSVPVDDGPAAPTVVAFSGATPNGTVTLNANGSFTYVPNAGFTGVDTFTFQVTDSLIPVTGTINITVSNMVRYVNNQTGANNPAGGDGRSTDAFETLAEAETASAANDIIFVFNGLTGTTPLTGGIALKNGQKLLGEGVGLTVGTFGSIVAAGSQPRVQSAGTTVAVLANTVNGNRTGVEIRGLDLQSTAGNAIDVTSANTQSLGIIISENTISGSGAALEGIDINHGSTGAATLDVHGNTVTASGTGIDLTRTAGTMTITAFNDNTVSGNTTGTGISIAGPVTFDATPGGTLNPVNGGTTRVGVSGNGVSGAGLVMTSVAGALDFVDLDIFADTSSALSVIGTGVFTGAAGTRITVTAGAGVLSAAAGPAVSLLNLTADLQLGGLTSTNSTADGVLLSGIEGTFTAPSTATIANASGVDVNILGGTAHVTYGGTIADDVGVLVSVASAVGGTKSFTGAITDGNDGDGSGISLTNNTGATITFSGGLQLSTGANPAFTATGGGTVNVCDDNPCSGTATGALVNTLTTTSGTALTVTNTTIGTFGLEFRSISANGAANGVSLNSTGLVGGLKVKGTGSAGSGGTIQNITNRGMSLVSTAGVDLNWIDFTSATIVNGADPTVAGSGCGDLQTGGNLLCNAPIHLVNVVGIGAGVGANLNRLNVTNSAQVGINLNNVTGLTISNVTLTGIGNQTREYGIKGRNLLGTVTISALSITGSFGDNFRVENNTGTTNITVTGSIFSNSTEGNGFLHMAQNTAVTSLTLSTNTVSGNFATGLFAGVNDPGASGSASVDVNGGSYNSNSVGIQVIQSGGADVTFDIIGANVLGNPAGGISLDMSNQSTAAGSLVGTISGNVVTQLASGAGNGIFTSARGAGTATIRVANNSVTNRTQYGIHLHRKEGQNGTLNATVTGNNVVTLDIAADTSFPIDGIRVEAGAVPTDTGTVCANISGNTATGAGTGPGGGTGRRHPSARTIHAHVPVARVGRDRCCGGNQSSEHEQPDERQHQRDDDHELHQRRLVSRSAIGITSELESWLLGRDSGKLLSLGPPPQPTAPITSKVSPLTPLSRRSVPLVVCTLLLVPALARAQKLVTGTGAGMSPSVRVIDSGGTDATFQPYAAGFLGGVRVALGDVTGDGVLDIITAAGPGGGPHVRVWNGTDLTEVGGFFAYSPAFSGGVFVAAGDVTGDGKADIITGAGLGGGPHVRVWDGATFAEVGGFFAYAPAFPGGVRVAAGDVTGDGIADIVTAPGPGGGPHVRVWNGATLTEVGGFFAYDPAFAGGVFVAAGDITGDGKAEIVTGVGPGGGPHVRVWNGADLTEVGGFFAYDPSFGGGVVVGLSDLDRDGRNEIMTAPGPGAPAQVRIWGGTSFSLWGAYLAAPPTFTGGVFIGSVAENPSTDDAPSVTTTTPVDGATAIPVGANLVVTFSEPVTVAAGAFVLECPTGAPIALTNLTASPATQFTLNPNVDLPTSTACTLRVVASQVTDDDGDDPPDTMAADATVTFTTAACGAITVSPTSVPGGNANLAYGALTFTQVGGTPPITWSVSSGTLPTGLMLAAATGILSGTPTQTGAFPVTITATAAGGCSGSVSVTLNIATGPNQAPTFTIGPNQTAAEDAGAQTVTPWATAISPGPPDEGAQTVTFNITDNTNAALFSAAPAVSPTGVLTYTPAPNVIGTATITLVLQDNGGTALGGVDTSAPQTFTITVTPVNDAPSFVVGADQIAVENAGPQTVAAWATALSPGPADEAGQALTFNVTGNTNAALFSAGPAVSPTGTLTFTPAPDANGTATITLTLMDNGGTAGGGVNTSAPVTFTITVTPVNSAPGFTVGPDQAVLEDAGPQTVVSWATAISAGPLDETGQTVTFNITGNTNAALFSVAPVVSPTGDLTYTPAPNVLGTATITLTLTDNDGTALGGVDTSAPQTFTITLTGVNDAPSFTTGANPSSAEDAGPRSIAGWATAISAGQPDEAGQSLTFMVTNNSNAALFSAAPAVSPTGTLTYTSAPNAFGTADITLVLQDNGGTANGGVNMSAPATFTITITPVNDPPALTTPVIAYATAGNTQLHVAGATIAGLASIADAASILSKSVPVDADGPVLPTVVAFSGATPNGTVAINADGSFTYVPNVGFAGTDTFPFQVTDSAASVAGTISISVSNMVWYVNNQTDTNNPVGGDGRSTDAFETLAAAESGSAANDIIFVFNGQSATTPLTDGITLKNGQKLHGEGVGLTVTGFGTLVVAGAQPRIEAAGNAVTVLANTANGDQTGVEIRGLNLASTGANAIDVTSANGQNLGVRISENTISGSGGTLEGIDINQGSTGTATLAVHDNSITAAGTGLDITRTLGAVIITTFDDNTVSGNTLGSGIVVNGPVIFDATPGGTLNAVNGGTTRVGVSGNGVSGAGMVLTSVTGSLAFGDLDLFADNGEGLSVTGTGAITSVSGTQITAVPNAATFVSANGPAVFLMDLTADLQAGGLTSTNSVGDGVLLSGVVGTFTAPTTASITDAGGVDFNIVGGTADVTYNGTITDDVGTLVHVAGTNGGTKSFTGAITDGNDGDGDGITLTGNGGATITFSGGLVLSTGGNAAFTATGGGTINVCDENPCNPAATGTLVNTLTTTTGTALSVANTTIGGNRLEFRSIAANGGVNGIVLNSTGAGGLSVVGVGSTAGSGGTIQNTTSRGASFISANNITLKNMNFTNTATVDLVPTNSGLSTGNNLSDNAAIHLQTVTGVTLDRIAITGSSEQGINGNTVTNFALTNSTIQSAGNQSDEDGLHFFNMLGANTITGSSITSSGDDNVNIQNGSGTSTITITGGAFNTGGLGSGLLFGPRGTTNTTISISGVTIDNNFSGGVVADASDTATMTLHVNQATITNNNDGVQVSGASGNVAFQINNANINGNDFAAITVLKAAFSTGGTLQGLIHNSQIAVANGRPTDAVSILQAGAGDLTVAVTGNTINYAGVQRAILLQGGQDGNGAINATITRNTIDIALDGTGNAVAGILAQTAITGPGNTTSMCASIGGTGAQSNTFTHSLGGAMAAGDIRVRQRNDGTVTLPGYAGAATDTAAVISYLNGRNTVVSASTATADSTGFAGGGGGCTAPIVP